VTFVNPEKPVTPQRIQDEIKSKKAMRNNGNMTRFALRDIVSPEISSLGTMNRDLSPVNHMRQRKRDMIAMNAKRIPKYSAMLVKMPMGVRCLRPKVSDGGGKM
jgi:hypothetical protein